MTKVLEGGALEIRDRYSFDAPPINSAEEWLDLKQRFYADINRFIFLVENLSDAKLESTFVDEKYGTFLRNMDSMIEHAYYHLGQIILIKKIIERQ